MVWFHSLLTPPSFPAPPRYGEHPVRALQEPQNSVCQGNEACGQGPDQAARGTVEGLTNAAVGPAYVLQAEALVHV